MEGRIFKVITLTILVALALTTIAATEASSSLTATGQCFGGEPPDAKDEDGSDGWDIYAPEGYVFSDAKVKAATDCYGDGAMYQITGIGTNHVTAVRLCEEGPECPEISHLEGMWEPEQTELCQETYPVVGEWGEWYTHPEDESQQCRNQTTIYYDVNEREYECNRSTETFCQPIPQPGEAGGSLSPYCGGGVNVTLSNATMLIQYDDQDPLIITEGGKYPLDLGSYIAWLEAVEGYEFPEGATTRWEFSIDRCPSPPPEPPTGFFDGPSLLPGLMLLFIGGAILIGKRFVFSN